MKALYQLRGDELAALPLQSSLHALALLEAMRHGIVAGSSIYPAIDHPNKFTEQEVIVAAARFFGAGLAGLVDADKATVRERAFTTWRQLSGAQRQGFCARGAEQLVLAAIFDGLAAGTHKFSPRIAGETVTALYVGLSHRGVDGIMGALDALTSDNTLTLIAEVSAPRKRRISAAEKAPPTKRRRKVSPSPSPSPSFSGSPEGQRTPSLAPSLAPLPYLRRNLRDLRHSPVAAPSFSWGALSSRASTSQVLGVSQGSTTSTATMPQFPDDLTETPSLIRAAIEEGEVGVEPTGAAALATGAFQRKTTTDEQLITTNDLRRPALPSPARKDVAPGTSQQATQQSSLASSVTPTLRTSAEASEGPAAHTGTDPSAPRTTSNLHINGPSTQRTAHFPPLGQVKLARTDLRDLLRPPSDAPPLRVRVDVVINGLSLAMSLSTLRSLISSGPALGAAVGAVTSVGSSLGELALSMRLLRQLVTSSPQEDQDDDAHPYTINGLVVDMPVSVLRELVADTN